MSFQRSLLENLRRIVYVLKAPLILHPPQETESIPAPLMEKILPSRIECITSGDYDKEFSSIADLVVYLYSASIKFPLSKEYVKIYTYYANKLFNNALSNNVKTINVSEKLTSYEESLAAELRRKIYKRQMKEVDKILKEIVKKPDEINAIINILLKKHPELEKVISR